MPLYKIAYTQEMEMYIEGESRSEVLAEFHEAMEIEIACGDVLSVSNVHVEFIDGDKFQDLYNLEPGDEITIKINGGHEEPVTACIVGIEYLDDVDSSKLGAAHIVLNNGWKGVARLSEIS